MADPRLIRTVDLDPSDIDTSLRLRPVSRSGVDVLVASVRELGVILDAVHVREVRRGGQPVVLRLMAGGHRVAACEALGMPVPAKVWSCTDDFARMLELDDNLACADLSPLDMAVFLADRRRLYLKLHPETAQGKAGAMARWDATELGSVAFSKTIAEARGITERQVRKIAQAGDALSEADAERLRGAAPVGLSDLIALAKVSPEEREHAIDRFVSRGMPRLRDAIRQVTAPPDTPVKDPVEAEYMDFQGRWKRLSKAAKRRFAAANASEMECLLADAGAADD